MSLRALAAGIALHAAAATVSAGTLSLASADGSRRLDLGGRVHADYTAWDGVMAATPGDGRERMFLRRARVELDGQLSDWAFHAGYNLVAHGSYDQVHVSYLGFGPHARLTFGQQKEGFGLDDSASANWVTGIERSISTMAFATGLHVGLKLHGGNERVSYAIGSWREDIDDSGPLDRALTGRFVVRPVSNDIWLVHLGVGATRRDGVPVDYGARLGIRGSEDGSAAGRVRAQLSGARGTRRDHVVEFGLRRGPLHVLAEYFDGRIDPDGHARGIEARGGYLTLGYVLTGEQREYRDVDGVFGGIRPRADTGAWEVFLRLDRLDVRNGPPAAVRGGLADGVTCGLNWYATAAIRVSADWQHVRVSRAVAGVDDGDAVLARLQFLF